MANANTHSQGLKHGLTWLAALAGGLAVAALLRPGYGPAAAPRVPVPELDQRRAVERDPGQGANTGTLVPGPGQPSRVAGSWPQFRGPDRSGRLASAGGLLRSWPAGGPKRLWEQKVGEGHAGPVVANGRVYLVDYDREKQEDAIRCLSLDDGREVWRYTYYVPVKRNHGMSRTVPTIANGCLVAMGPRCHVHALRADTGERLWQKDLVAECSTVEPRWYAGQCPLVDDGVVILAPGGNPLLMAVELETGTVRWQTPNPGCWGMTHSSVAVFDHSAGRQYVYCSTEGVVGVAAKTGEVLWKTTEWKITIANIPTPVPVGGDRLLFTGGYNAGAALLQVKREGESYLPTWGFRVGASVFGSDQHTPILYDGRLYGVLPSPTPELACLDLQGKLTWTSGKARRFGLGPYLLAGDLMYVLGDQDGTLVLFQVAPDTVTELATAKVLSGHDAWGPMALVSGRLLVRDLETLVCLQVGELDEPK